MAPAEPNLTSKPEIQVGMPDIVKFIRQLGHDLRNHLNAAELQAAYLAEIVKDPEASDEIKRLRAMISQVGESLQSVTTALSQPRLTAMTYTAVDFVGDLREKVAADYPGETVEWDIQVGDASMEIDPQALQPALLELFANASCASRNETSSAGRKIGAASRLGQSRRAIMVLVFIGRGLFSKRTRGN